MTRWLFVTLLYLLVASTYLAVAIINNSVLDALIGLGFLYVFSYRWDHVEVKL